MPPFSAENARWRKKCARIYAVLLVLSFLSAFALRLMVSSIISPILGYCFFTALGLISSTGIIFRQNQTRHFKEENRMAIILRLDRVMADRKMSLGELSERVGVSNVNLSKIKTGKVSAIRFSTLNAICRALNCQPGDIMEYKEDGEDSVVY